jgi:lysophospholipase L1-like esterase
MDYNIFCIGDSITYGLFDSEGGWCDRLKKHFLQLEMKNQRSIRVWNIGISGQIILDFVSKPERQSYPYSLIKKSRKNIFIIAFGANDAAFDTITGAHLVPHEKFTQTLQGIIDGYNVFGEVVLLDITPVSVSVEKVKDTYNCYRSNLFVTQYNDILSAAAFRNNIQLISVNNSFNANGVESLLCEDGLHPNSKGHEIIFNAVLSSLNSKALQKQ